MPKEAQFQPSTLQLNSELLQECCQTGKRFSTLSHSKHQLPRITAEESQILLLNSDYSTKSKNLKIHRLPRHTNSRVLSSLKHKRSASKGNEVGVL